MKILGMSARRGGLREPVAKVEPDPAAPPEMTSAALAERLRLEGMTLREHTARGALINAAFSIALAGLGAMRGLVVAVFLSAGEYGLWGLIFVTVATLVWLKQIGISDKFIQQSEPDQELAFQKAFTLELLWTSLFVVLILAALPLFAVVYGRDEIVLPGAVLALGVLVTALQTPTWIFYREMSFARQRVLQSIEPVVGFVVTIALAAAGAGYWSLVIGFIVGTSCAAVAALRACPYPLRFRFERRAVREYVGFSWPLLLSSASGLIAVQVAVIVGQKTTGLAGVGAIGLAGNIARFADQADGVVTSTLYPAICAVRDRVDLLFESFVKSNRLALVWGMPFGFGLALFAPDIVTYILGEKWQVVEGLLRVFGITYALKQIAFNWTAFHMARAETRPIAVNGIATLVAFVAVLVPAMFLWGLTGYAVAICASVAVQLLVRAYYLGRLFNGFNFLRHSLRAITPTIPAVGAVLGARWLESGGRPLGMVVGELVLYATITAAATWIFERSLLREIAGYLRGMPRPRAA